MIGTPFFGGHVVRWTPYFRGTSLTLRRDVDASHLVEMVDVYPSAGSS